MLLFFASKEPADDNYLLATLDDQQLNIDQIQAWMVNVSVYIANAG
jgi:hypothetical protein